MSAEPRTDISWSGPGEPGVAPASDLIPEIGALFAAAYLRLLLGGAPDAATPPHVATCAARKSGSLPHNPLDAPPDTERPCVHGQR